MLSVALANLLLAIPFLFAFVAIPLWITFRRPEMGADHSQARGYLRARAAVAQAGR